MNNRVFISSTCYDLIDLRAELQEFIVTIGMNPVMSDQSDSDFETYQDKNSIETCLVNLRSCSIVIVVLSQRYGPSLKKAGFEDISATHLEYKEAIKSGIKTIVFVRDKLEADNSTFQKTNDPKSLSWLKEEKDFRIFDIIEEHKKLSNDDTNNWYWTFKNSVELKRRLKVDLKSNINSIRLNSLIENGNVPLLTVVPSTKSETSSNRYLIDLSVSNIGTQVAIEPIVVLFKNESYREVVEGDFDKSIVNYSLKHIKSLMSGETYDSVDFEIEVTDKERSSGIIKLVLELVYRTINGDLISDVSEIEIRINITAHPFFYSKYTTKRYRSGSSFELMVKE